MIDSNSDKVVGIERYQIGIVVIYVVYREDPETGFAVGTALVDHVDSPVPKIWMNGPPEKVNVEFYDVKRFADFAKTHPILSEHEFVRKWTEFENQARYEYAQVHNRRLQSRRSR